MLKDTQASLITFVCTESSTLGPHYAYETTCVPLKAALVLENILTFQNVAVIRLEPRYRQRQSVSMRRRPMHLALLGTILLRAPLFNEPSDAIETHRLVRKGYSQSGFMRIVYGLADKNYVHKFPFCRTLLHTVAYRPGRKTRESALSGDK